MIGLLEELEGAYLAFFKLTEIFHGQGCEIHIDAANGASVFAHSIDSVNGIKDIAYAGTGVGLAGNEKQALMSLAQQYLGLVGNFLHTERLAGDFTVAATEGAVQALVGADVGEVERCKEHDPLAVDLLFHSPCRVEELLAKHG